MMRTAILASAAIAVSLAVLLASLGTDSLAQTPPGIEIPPGTEWISLSDRAAIVVSDFSVHNGSVRGRLMIELEGQWAPVRLIGFEVLPLQ